MNAGPHDDNPAVTLTRFAPAPTGFLHLGHVVNALYVWGLARTHGAEVLLRIEDHDRTRSTSAYEAALLDDLDWLGFAPDCHSTDSFRAGRSPSRQSDRGDVYAHAAEDLAARGLVYACTCSRRDVARAASIGDVIDTRYPGTCRDRGLPLSAGVRWRLRLGPGAESFDDLLMGAQSQDPDAQCGDVVIRDHLGQWTYQFVASVDDHRQGIDFVVRGGDLLPSTARQIRIAHLIGRATPARFAHHPLVMKSPTEKLSKADRDTSVRDMARQGSSPPRLIGEAAFRAGLLPAGRYLSADDVPSLFGG